MPETTYLLWSNKHQMWWRPDALGYPASARSRRPGPVRLAERAAPDVEVNGRKAKDVT